MTRRPFAASTRPPWKYFCVNSGSVIASQICSGVALMYTL
jgi:hypothetical protein